MEHLITALKAAKPVADLIPVPGVGTAVELALSLAELAKDVKDTEDDCKALAERAAELSLGIYDQLRLCGTALDGSSMTEHVERLISVLGSIEDMMKRRRTFWRRIVQRQKMVEQVTKLSDKLESAVSLFQVQALVRTGQQQAMQIEMTSRILMTVEGLASMNVDEFQLSVRDVVLGEVLTDDEIGPSESAERVAERYSAVLHRGTDRQKVVVKRFREKNHAFAEEVKLAKKLWHPNILQFVGYSPNQHMPFLAFNMVSHVGSFEALGCTMDGLKKFLWVLDATKQIHDALNHLKSKATNMRWTPDEDIDPITSGSQLIVTGDSRIVLDVSRCSLDKLPNLVILYDWTIELNGPARAHIQNLKKDPLALVPPHQRRAALSDLWQTTSTFVEFLNEARMFWTHRRIVLPGECFRRARAEILEGLFYEDQLQFRKLAVEGQTGMVCPFPLQTVPGTEAGERRDTRRARMVKEVRVEYDTSSDDLMIDDQREDYVAVDQWRRYTVPGMEFGWYLRTMTVVRESGDCRGWFVRSAIGMRDLHLDMGDLAIATALTFTTVSYPVTMLDRSGRRRLPLTLYFHERVHEYPRASLDPDLDWPWGFWSEDPDAEADIELIDDAHLARSLSIAFQGVVEGNIFRWLQIVGDCLFHIDVRVEAEYCQFTADEGKVLQEINEASDVENEYRRNPFNRPDNTVMDVDDPMWEEEEVDTSKEAAARVPSCELEPAPPFDEYTVALGLSWLREAELPWQTTWDEIYRQKQAARERAKAERRVRREDRTQQQTDLDSDWLAKAYLWS
ncbi:hypothetical protein C8Q78DRAFT_668693 [Trametes maxima]|nr:hypothetical protein C8Q78DRAFT_668693 [Trametes maxima]